MDYRRLLKWSIVLNILFAMTLIMGAFVMRNINDNIVSGQRQRRSFNAETRFQHCARVGISDPKKEADMNKMCAGYDTLDEAYESERNR